MLFCCWKAKNRKKIFHFDSFLVILHPIMKQIVIFLLMSLYGMTAMAQNTTGYVFCDKDGNEITATEITCSNAEDDGFGGILVPSGLYVKNVSGDDGTTVAVKADITRLDNGSVQVCFPLNCLSKSTTGEIAENGKGTIAIGQVKDLMTEWLPTAYGECVVEYTATIYKGAFKRGSFSITANYKYVDAAGAGTLPAVGNSRITHSYDLSGRRATKGLRIVRKADGTVRKVIR